LSQVCGKKVLIRTTTIKTDLQVRLTWLLVKVL
jgi:hypothetical protein